MPRRPRNQLPPAGVYHVTARGVDRCLIVRDECDWRALQELVVTAQRRFDWTCDAYCLMSSHFHLLARTTLSDLSRGMHWLNGAYALRFNRRWGRVGHLFQNRFDAWVIRDELSLGACVPVHPRQPGQSGAVRVRRRLAMVRGPSSATVDTSLSATAGGLSLGHGPSGRAYFRTGSRLYPTP